jgi:hypothetical protein
MTKMIKKVNCYKLQADFKFKNGGSGTMNTETTNNREELFKEGLLQAVLELASAYETGAITSERFAEKVCGLRNIYFKEVGGRYETRV